MSPRESARSIAVVGGGLAGVSAACVLADAEYKVSVFERRPYLGGRASSYEHPGTGEVVDNCQHVLLGCCTNLIDFYQRLGVQEKIEWSSALNFIEPGGRCSVLQSSPLPAPLHSAFSFLLAPFLDYSAKDAIARGLLRFIFGLPRETDESFLSWLRRHAQPEQAIERFWKPVLVSALNEDLDRVSIRYAAQVFRESFLKSAKAGLMGVPRVPLTDLYASAGVFLAQKGGEVKLRCAVERIELTEKGIMLHANGQQLPFDAAILAVPFEAVAKLLPDGEAANIARSNLERFEHSPITGVHLWFDRPVTDLPHAVLLDRTMQWMFNKSFLQRRPASEGYYLELVVSASKSLVEMSRQEIIDLALSELREFFPLGAEAKLQKATVIKEVRATFSVRPQIDKLRPAAATPWPNLFLAGDWTATGWPATMEGAVRSGYLAAEAITVASGDKRSFVVPDLPATGFMRLFD